MTRVEALDLHMKIFDEWYEAITEDMDRQQKTSWEVIRPQLLMSWKASYIAEVFK